MIPVTIYSRASCRPCEATKRWFSMHGIHFKEIDVDAPENAQEASKLPVRSLPYTIIENFPIEGFAPSTFKAVLEDFGVHV